MVNLIVVTILTALSNCNCTVEGGSGGIAPQVRLVFRVGLRLRSVPHPQCAVKIVTA